MFFISIELQWSRHIFCLAPFILLFTSTVGQIQQSGRYETAIGETEKDLYEVITVQERGIILYRNVTNAPGNQIELVHVDTTLKEAWRGYIQLNQGEAVVFTHVKDDILYFLIKSRYSIAGDFAIAAMKIETGTYFLYSVRNLIPFNPTAFTVTDGSALVGGYYNYRPLVLHYNFKLQQSKLLPGFFNDSGELTQLKPNQDGTVDVIVSAKNSEKRKSLSIRNYDSTGTLIKNTVLEPEEKKNLIFGRSHTMPNGEQVVSGIYGRYPEYARGLFVASINLFGEYSIRYYPFADLEHFFNYMKARREKRVKEKIDRRRIKGKKIKLNYRMLVQELIPYGNQYLLLGEAFYPHYVYPSNIQVFDGYQYTHAVVIGFDKSGRLLWDNSFEINDVKTWGLEQFVKIYPQDDKIILLYLFESAIRSKIISGSDVLEGKSIQEIKLNFEGDQVKKNETKNSKLDYWYGNNFIAHGVQIIHNIQNQKVEATRKVFFINKITPTNITR